MIILIRDLKLSTIIGAYSRERMAPQTLCAQIELTLRDMPARYTDNLGDTVDYEALENRLVDVVNQNQPALIERLAQILLDACLAFDTRIIDAKVELEKPGCLKHARAAVVKIASRGISPLHSWRGVGVRDLG